MAGNTNLTRPENRVFYPALDGVRACAFLLVFFVHYKGLPWGATGVNMFFVLSGFLITGILWDTRDDAFRVRNFYLRRTLRIFPLYYGVFVILLLLTPLVHWWWRAGWVAWPLYVGNFLRFTSPAATVAGSSAQRLADAQLQWGNSPYMTLYMGHFWSLCVEEQFYLLWPWVVFRVRSRRALLIICWAVVLLVPIARVVAQQMCPAWMLEQELLYRQLPFQIDALLLGGLIALLWRGEHRDTLRRYAPWVAGLLLLTAAVYVGLTLHSLELRSYRYPSWRFTGGLPFVNVLTAALIVCCLRSKGVLFHFFHWRPLRWLGRLSYGAYVFHDIPHGALIPIGIYFFHTGMRVEWAVTAMGLVSSIVLASLSFRFYESRFLNLKERWTRSGKNAAAA